MTKFKSFITESKKILDDESIRAMFDTPFVGYNAGSVYYLPGNSKVKLAMRGGAATENGVEYIILTLESKWELYDLNFGKFGKGILSGFSKIYVGLKNDKVDIKIRPKYSDKMYSPEENDKVKNSSLKKLYI